MNKATATSLLVAVIICALFAFLQTPAPLTAKPNQIHSLTNPGSLTSLTFTENQGQWPDQILFRAESGGATMWFTQNGSYYQFTRFIPQNKADISAFAPGYSDLAIIPDRIEKTAVMTSFVGANDNPQLSGEDKLDYKCNFFLGSDPSKWRRNVTNYSSLIYREVYPGIDLKYYANGGRMEYDFIVSPNSDPSQIRIRLEGNGSLSVNDAGELIIKTVWGEITEHTPVAYQPNGDRQQPIQASYMILSNREFGFQISGDYDPDLPLVIDPVLVYSTYLGGSGDDRGYGIATDDEGNTYITGYTTSSDFPLTNPFDITLDGGIDVFVTKINSQGDGLVYSTYVGGSSLDFGWSIAVDGSGSAFITGQTYSSDFPTVNPYQPLLAGGDNDAFVFKLNSQGNDLAYGTYLGGNGSDWSWDIAVDAGGGAYITGGTGSSNFPRANPYDATLDGDADVFVSKLNFQGNNLIYSTYLGGNSEESEGAYGIAVDGGGNAYITGWTLSGDFPIVNPLQFSKKGGYDLFVTKLNSLGTSLVYSTFIGGNGNEWGWDIAVDNDGCAYVTGGTESLDFPTVNHFDATLDGVSDAFVVKLKSSGNGLIYSTYLGGGSGLVDRGFSIAVDGSSQAYVTGWTASTDFPTENPLQATNAGGYDAFITMFDTAGNSLVYSTYLGGSGDDWGGAVAVDGNDDAYLTGFTPSTDFPTSDPLQAALAGSSDIFVAKISYTCIDTDGDGFGDTGHPENDCPEDNCPTIHNPDQKDYDHDGEGDACDTDDDGDGFPDTSDNCPLYWNPGQEDNDGDGLGDACDPDDDNDGIADDSDNCIFDPNPGQEDTDRDQKGDVCDPDDDNDGVNDETDNCPLDRNPAQEDTDLDGAGDACDDDDDNDSKPDSADNCPLIWNPDQADGDGDNIGDPCDNCPNDNNPLQTDTDDDGEGNACDNDDDGDGVPDGSDNCPLVYNPGQEDSDGDGIGDVCVTCCIGLSGNVDCDPSDMTDLGDLTRMIDYLFISFSPLCCASEANIDGDAEELVDLVDLTRLIDFLFISFTPPAPCL